MNWVLILEDIILGYWSYVHVYMDIQSIFTIALEVLEAGVKVILTLQIRHTSSHYHVYF